MKSICKFSRLGMAIALLPLAASCFPLSISSSTMPFTLASPDLPTSLSDTPTTPNTAQATEQDIWTQMRQGTGYVVLLRHAQTVPGTGDPPGFRLDDCSTQRNLSAAGRDQAVRIGRVFRDRNIPITQVLSSQYCRCLETAKLLDLGAVQPSPMLNSIFEDRTTATQQTQQVRQQILNHRNTPGVIIMVSHFANISELSSIGLQSGGAVVMRANQQGELKVVGQIQRDGNG
ncbi:histidine phosphatase family protein [Chroococcidiopsis sp. CCALA 051]|nr:histidine phosphatase family protein [Chroococcidiopsis sp. CCALA 051]